MHRGNPSWHLVRFFEKSDPDFEIFDRDSRGIPFEYRWISSGFVEFRVQQQVYRLECYGLAAKTPFRYRFEDHGDPDVVSNGRVHDIDCPHDIDIKSKK